MTNTESEKLAIIQLVMQEREKMAEIAKELIELLDSIPSFEPYEHWLDKHNNSIPEKSKYTEIRKKTIGLLQHLANIGGHCDKDSQWRIEQINKLAKLCLEGVIHFDALRGCLCCCSEP